MKPHLVCTLVTLLTARVALPDPATAAGFQDPPDNAEIIVYGGTAGGVAAAIQAARMGKRVLLVEPGEHIGGLTSGGLGATDIGNKAAIGGISREFYRRVGEHYARDESWKYETRDQYRSGRQQSGEVEMWTFEPHVAEEILRAMLAEAHVPVIFHERLDLKNGVHKDGQRIVSIRMESGLTLTAGMFIDATYEGDLMARAGVSYHVGRESNATYGETLSGVQPRLRKHQFQVAVDPYIKPGDPSSGLLPGIQGTDPGKSGEGDHRVQAYNFRMCLTNVPENRIAFPKPAGYDPMRYELYLRTILAGQWDGLGAPAMMPNRKTDTNNNGAFSTDNIGMNYDYPDGDYVTRERVFKEHVTYQQGMMWFLANDPRVPERIRREANLWGLAKDEFVKTGGWPHQMYIREARRMIGPYVMTQHNCQGRAIAEDPVGLAAYTMDSHNVQRYADEGRVWNEGDVQVGGFSPYPISYRSMVPKESDCTNLLVPVCLSASHIAYGSIRMEPVFMVLGQSAATAAAQAIDQRTSIQGIDRARLRKRLSDNKQVLAWTGPKPQPPLDAKQLPGFVIDDAQAEIIGPWSESSSVGGFVGARYLHDGDANKGQCRIRYTVRVPIAGRYEVRISYTPNANRATNARVGIVHAGGTAEHKVNQQMKPAAPNGFVSLGTYRFATDSPAAIEISNAGADGHVIADAVQLVPSGEP
ncbi:MAG: FAD-dependent oxidoreductase [Planctomycetes bacterium]|nr:FAD-dependent oxidoreductase [Planctomycetota bacterium]